MTPVNATLPSGRSVRWRLGTAAAGIVLAAAGAALVWRPALLSYVVAGALGAAGLLLLVSALLAKGRGGDAPGTPPTSPP